jgi:hypothetical protein
MFGWTVFNKVSRTRCNRTMYPFDVTVNHFTGMKVTQTLRNVGQLVTRVSARTIH